MKLDKEALATAISAAYPHRYDGASEYIGAAITAYLTALANQEGAQAEPLQAPDWELAVARKNATEELAYAEKHGAATLGSGWLRGLVRFLEGVKPIPTQYGSQEDGQAPKPVVPSSLARRISMLSHHCFWLEDIGYREDIRDIVQKAVSNTLKRASSMIEREGAQVGEREFAYVEGPKGSVRFDLGSKTTPPASDEAVREAVEAFRNADDEDWLRLFDMIDNSGHGRFWKAVFNDFLRARKGGRA